jgi:hypothetical protein
VNWDQLNQIVPGLTWTGFFQFALAGLLIGVLLGVAKSVSRRLAICVCCLLLLSRVALSQASLVGTCQAAHGTGGANPAVTAGVDTTGATLLTVVPGNVSAVCTGTTISDSKGNSWHCAGEYGTATHAAIWYAWDHAGSPLATGAGHTVSFTGNYPGIVFRAFGATRTSSDPLRTQTGNQGSGTTMSTNSITPTLHDLVISGLGTGGASPYTINAPLTTDCGMAFASGVNIGAASGYQLDAAGSALNQIWSMGSGTHGATIASFVTAPPACTISTASLPGGTSGSAYSQTIATANCTSPTFSVSVGALPTGLTLTTGPGAGAGTISGTPSTVVGSPFSFTIAVADANGTPTKALSIAIAGTCVNTTASGALTAGVVGTSYSPVTIGTTGCTSPSFAVTSGALPAGLTLTAAVISGTPTSAVGTPFSFSVTITDASGNSTTAYTIATTAPTNILTGPTCAGNSPSTVKCTWTTDMPSSSQILAGTVSGGPYTTYQTTEVYMQASGPGAGVTSHTMVIPGLPTNTSSTAYYFEVRSRQPGGSFATSAQTASGTLAAMVSTPMSVQFSPVTRYNDQYNGVNGMPNTGLAANEDGFYPTMWADDGKIYSSSNDASGLASGHGSYTGTGKGVIYSMSPADGTPAAAVASLRTLSAVNRMTNFGGVGVTNTCINGLPVGSGGTTGCWTDGASWYTSNGIAFNGRLVLNSVRGGSGMGTWGDSSLIVSSDHGATWLAPQNYPGGTPNANGDPPTGGTAMWTGYGVSNKCANIYLIQHGQDYGFTNPANFVKYGNADAYVYGICYSGDGMTSYAARIRVENFLLLDVTKWQYCTAACFGNGGADGLLDTSWTSTLASAAAIGDAPYNILGASTGTSGLGNGAASCAFGHTEFIPDFNRWMRVCGATPGAHIWDDFGTTLAFDTAYPWGPAFTLVAGLPRVQSNLNYKPGFANPLASTYQKVSSTPLVSQITIMTSGAFYGTLASTPATDEYSPHWFTARLVPAAATPARLLTGNGRNQHVSNGLDLFYNFQGAPTSGSTFGTSKGSTFSYLIPDLAAAKYSIALPVSTPAIFDQYGMINFGYWSGFATACSPACAVPVNYTLPSPYAAALTDFTVAVVFAHYPNSMPAVAGEMVLDKTDFQLARSGTTANLWTVKVGTTTSAPFALPTDVSAGGTTWPALLIRRVGTVVNVYSSAGISTAGGGPTVLATFSDGTALGANALNIGATLHGTMAELLVWNRGLSDGLTAGVCELCRAGAALRNDMRLRGITLP